jgi:DNA-binding LacI/PurR family transcriptional regulator
VISVLHIGLPLAPPWLTSGECEKVSARLKGIQQRMEAAGYRYFVVQASPAGGLADFREQLRREAWDAVLIGGGVAADPKLAEFKQQIVAAVRDEAPGAKVLEFDHGLDVPLLVGRAFGFS